jgi:hypothetical protein
MTPRASPSTDEMGETWPLIRREASAYRKHEHRVGARALGVRVVQSSSPAVADIMGARRAGTVEMISSMSIPCR